MKKSYLLPAIICCMFLFSQPLAADIPYFSDLTGHWGETNVYSVADFGLINGYPDNSFHPDSKITRTEFLKILALDANENLAAYDRESNFPDVAASFWGRQYINWGAAKGIIDGYPDQTFQPDATISRQEMAVILYRYAVTYRGLTLPLAKDEIIFSDENTIGDWAQSAVKAVQRGGIINGYGDGSFAPLSGATRAESATMIANYLNIYYPAPASPRLITDLYSNGVLVKTNVTLIEENGILLIGARTFFEAAAFRLTYYEANKLIVADDMKHDIEFCLDQTTYYAMGIKRSFSVPPRLVDGVTYLPLKEAAAAAGFSAILHHTGNAQQYLGLTYQDSFLTRNVNNFYGTAATGGNVKGNVFFADGSQNGGFFGEISAGAMSYGSYTTDSGDLYFGNWSNASLNGAGRWIKESGEFFVGTFRNGAKDSGVTYYPDGSTFSGSWTTSTSGSVYPGKGTYVDKDGNVFGNDAAIWNNGAITVK